MATMRGKQGTSPDARVDALVAWAEESGRRRAGEPARGGLRFVLYGRVSTEDWQDPVTSRARQLGDAGPHPNKAHAARGRRARHLEPDPPRPARTPSPAPSCVPAPAHHDRSPPAPASPQPG